MNRLEKPWGWYEEVFSETPNYKCKRLYINPNQRFSLQTHQYRNEYWTVVQGSGTVVIGESTKNVNVGDFIFIPRTIQHRLTSDEQGITIIEVQIGDPCLEEDITRLEDDYNRI